MSKESSWPRPLNGDRVLVSGEWQNGAVLFDQRINDDRPAVYPLASDVHFYVNTEALEEELAIAWEHLSLIPDLVGLLGVPAETAYMQKLRSVREGK